MDEKKRIQEVYEKTILLQESSDVNNVADDITRLIMGDKDIALKNLAKSLPLQDASFQPGSEYNNAFTTMRVDIAKAIKKALKAAR